MKVNFAHLCDYALVANGKLSVMGIFDQIGAQAFPWSHPTLYIAYELGLEPAEMGTKFKVRIVMQDEDGGEVMSLEGSVQTEPKGKIKIGDSPKARQVLCLNGVTFTRGGPHQIVIFLQGQVAHTIRFDVLQRPQQPGKDG